MNPIGLIPLALTLLIPNITSAAEQASQTVTDQPVSAKILGGSDASPSSWPWATAILDAHQPDLFNAQYCGGVLIATDWVLTAGHCVWQAGSEGTRPTSSIEVAVGAYDLNNYRGTRREVITIIAHPGFNPDTLDNDIALLRLATPSDQPTVPIFTGASREHIGTTLEGETSTLIGWGQDSTERTYPHILQEVDLPIVEPGLCNDQFNTTLAGSQLCAGFAEGGGKDVCNGDSGGAMMVQIDNEWTHVGLVSAGRPCSDNGAYGIYTRTSAFDDFIRQYVPEALFTPLEEEVPEEEPEPAPQINIVPLIHPLLDSSP